MINKAASAAAQIVAFDAWLMTAKPGDWFVYARSAPDWRPHPQVLAHAREAKDKGLVTLVQKRLGPERYEYRAIVAKGGR